MNSAVHQGTEVFDEAERGAMRAFLARAEVRFSTMHRIATAFVSGAGLLLLIPIFFKDAIDDIITVLLAHAGNLYPELGDAGTLLSALLFGLVAYLLLVSLAIPLYALYLLLKDIVHFYFTLYAPGFPEDLLNPTFSLTGLVLSSDEAPQAKREVMRYQYTPGRADLMMPFSPGKRRLYFDRLIENTGGRIIPASRRPELLLQAGVLPPNCDPQAVNQVNAALGIARSLDRTLAQEVAHVEMGLVRNVMYLRRLVLRYIKALLMFIWTMVISFVMLPFLRDGRLPTFLIFGAGYLVWALAVLPLIRLPFYWMYRHRGTKPGMGQVDAQLTLLEQTVGRYCYAAIAAAALLLLLATAVYL